MDIEGHALTGTSVSADGTTIRFDFVDQHGVPATLRLPIDQAGSIAMTLPTLIEKAMRTQFHDESLRYVFPLGTWSLEQSTDPKTVMMTLKTPDGFGVCFSLKREQSDAIRSTLDGAQNMTPAPALN